MSSSHKFLYVVGPTAVGKTELSLRLAETLQWPVVNCDSVQVYKEVNIGTAKPSAAELKRVPHFLFDYVPAPQKQTAAQYLQDVVGLLEKKKIEKAIFVGGSGFYVQALEKGLYPNSETPAEVKREVDLWIQSEGFAALYQWLKKKDEAFSLKISGNDHYRIRRAVEVMKTQQKTMTELKQQMSEESHSPLPEHQSLKIGIRQDKEVLRERVKTRTRQMLQAGFVEEVRLLLDQGLKDWAPMQSVGYKEVQNFLNSEQSEEDLFEYIVTSTMQLIKKQMTWFKRDSQIQWFSPDQMQEAVNFAGEWALK